MPFLFLCRLFQHSEPDVSSSSPLCLSVLFSRPVTKLRYLFSSGPSVVWLLDFVALTVPPFSASKVPSKRPQTSNSNIESRSYLLPHEARPEQNNSDRGKSDAFFLTAPITDVLFDLPTPLGHPNKAISTTFRQLTTERPQPSTCPSTLRRRRLF